ncbi:NAD(P)-binding protein [Pleurostoma richardsiae]|uniref:NAD(P)-binding protein n=1 Tax=Pleurostoma richardsiae TaxID=41990 RepID=A0AA38RRZ0_9PEZI|nr:NAD(P)-binding protein [Pleurostoma richardsiae]
MSRLDDVTDEEMAAALNGKTIIITGGADGIGKSAALLAHAAGANVAVGDLNETAGEKLVSGLKDRVLFVPTDVSSWSAVLNLFAKAWEEFGRIDVVLSNAGIHAFETLFEDNLEEDGTLAAPTLKSLEVNLHGALYCTKAAIHYFQKQPERCCQLVLTGSAASIIDTPPLFLYCAGKAGLLGLMRGLRKGLPSDQITVNMVAPFMTVTAMLPDWIKEKWQGLPANDSTGVARALLLPAVRPKVNGKTLWVAGNEIIEIEDALHAAQPQWLGPELSKAVDEGQIRLGIGI